MQVMPRQSMTPLLWHLHVSPAQGIRALVQVHLSQPRLQGPLLCLVRTGREAPRAPQLLLTLGSQLRPWLSLGSPEPSPHPHPPCPLSSSCSLPPLPTWALCQLRLGWRTWQTACSPPAPSAWALLAPGCSPASNLVSTPASSAACKPRWIDALGTRRV